MYYYKSLRRSLDGDSALTAAIITHCCWHMCCTQLLLVDSIRRRSRVPYWGLKICQAFFLFSFHGQIIMAIITIAMDV